jgi:hypothetical protein
VNLLSVDFPLTLKNNHPKSICAEYHPNNFIIEDLGHSWGTHLKNCLGAVFQLGFNKASYYLENLAFSRL